MIFLFHLLFMLRSLLWLLFLLLLSLRSVFLLLRTDGSSLRLFRNRLCSRLLTDIVQVNLSQRLILLLSIRLQQAFSAIVLLLWRTLLIFCFFGKEFLSLITNLSVLTEGIIQCLVLLVGEFEARFCLDISQVFSFL